MCSIIVLYSPPTHLPQRLINIHILYCIIWSFLVAHILHTSLTYMYVPSILYFYVVFLCTILLWNWMSYSQLHEPTSTVCLNDRTGNGHTGRKSVVYSLETALSTEVHNKCRRMDTTCVHLDKLNICAQISVQNVQAWCPKIAHISMQPAERICSLFVHFKCSVVCIVHTWAR